MTTMTVKKSKRLSKNAIIKLLDARKPFLLTPGGDFCEIDNKCKPFSLEDCYTILSREGVQVEKIEVARSLVLDNRKYCIIADEEGLLKPNCRNLMAMTLGRNDLVGSIIVTPNELFE